MMKLISSRVLAFAASMLTAQLFLFSHGQPATASFSLEPTPPMAGDFMELEAGLPDPPSPSEIATHRVTLGTPDSSGFSYAGQQQSNLGSFEIVINAGSTLASNAPALAAFERAAGLWESYIADPVTVTVDADLANLGSTTIIGQASSVVLQSSFDGVRNAIVADAADEPDDGIVAYLPTAAQYSVDAPSGFTLDGNISGTKANFKALGYSGLDSQFGATDARITFNTGFSFDYDNSDGVTANTIDFETVAAHEIGHALGFVSTVDMIDYYYPNPDEQNPIAISPRILDLFRFDNDGSNDPSTAAEFTTFPRSLVPGNDEVTDQINGWGTLTDTEFRMATGSSNGDGRQASHWKDNLGLGLMDPTLSYGTVVPISQPDLRAFDLIGWEIAAIPEPGTLLLLLCGTVAALATRRNRGRSLQ